MAYDVLVVEDEPAARRYVSSVIDQQCPGFSVAASAEHGEAALGILAEHSVDLVITDARMPVLDGIGLIREMRRREMDEPVLVLSGYDDYDYVRGALTSGAVDYVLKPAGVQRMRAALEGITPHVVDRVNRQRARALARTVVHPTDGGTVSPGISKPCHLAVIRVGGMPLRSPRPTATGLETYFLFESLLIVPGRDEQEIVCVASTGGEDSVDTPSFRSAVGKLVERLEETVPFLHRSAWSTRTVGFAQRPASGEDLRDRFLRISASIDQEIRPGRTMEVGEVAGHAFGRQPMVGATERELERIRVAVADGNLFLLGTVVDEFQKRWVAQDLPLHEIRRTTEEVLRLSGHHAPVEAADRLCADPANCAEVAAGLQDALHIDDPSSREPGLFRAIRDYVDEHYRDHLSLKEVADHFRLSSSYVGKLFRKHRQTSLGDYVTARRIELAQDLLLHDPDVAIKQVAATCGFEDQFYFSRVFKSHTGFSPSEFRQNAEESP